MNKLNIDREHACKVFAEYVKNYNAEDSKVKLKIEHTYRVAGLSEAIAKSIGLSGEALELAWLIGLLHDIGRFEQLKNYGTFIDSESIDHAKYGCSILFDEGVIRDYLKNDFEDELIRTAIHWHNEYRIPEELDERTKMYCNILRDADKIDILKANCDFPLEEIYNTTTEVLKNEEVTKEVMDNFRERKAVLRSLKKASIDHIVGHISLTFELVYKKSLELMVSQGYLQELLDFKSDNPITREQFEKLKVIIKDYVDTELC